MLELLRSPRFRFETEDPPDSLEPYGLDAPVTVVDLSFGGSEPIQVRLGGQTPDGVRQYAQINDAESVIMIETEWGAALANLVLDPPPTAAPAEEEDTDGHGQRRRLRRRRRGQRKLRVEAPFMGAFTFRPSSLEDHPRALPLWED